MTITFPRELPADIAFQVRRFEPIRNIAGVRSKNRIANRSEVSDPVWVADLEAPSLSYTKMMGLQAWLQSLRGGLRQVHYRHVRSCYPAAHPGDGGVANDPGNLVSVVNGNELTVDSVDAGLILTPGDLIGIEATHQALGIVTEATGIGMSRVITIEPAPPADVAVPGAVVRFVRPGLPMRLVPGSIEISGTTRYSVSFRLEESR